MQAEQRKSFFGHARRIGKGEAYAVLSRIAGVTSMRSPVLTDDIMTRVLKELARMEVRKNEEPLLPRRIREDIAVLRRRLGMSIQDYTRLCRRNIKKDAPVTQREGRAILAALKNMVKTGWKASR